MTRGRALAWVIAPLVALGCSHRHPEKKPAPRASVAPRSSAPVARGGPPALLYLPDGGDIAPPGAPGPSLFGSPGASSGRCPPDMVDVRGEFCIDRFEDSLVDVATGRRLSPYYFPSRAEAQHEYAHWRRAHAFDATERGRTMPVPAPPAWELEHDVQPKAVSLPGVPPSGYVNEIVAQQACHNAGKRLCTPAEWVTACRGEQNRPFPYGDHYEPGVCNVDRASHPSVILHGDASIDHLDPRLNEVTFHGEPLLKPTGASPDCRSQWGSDAVYDMVGNLDEWVDDPSGEFLGGFYSRPTHAGCEARITTHPANYFDYSLGVRCCK